MIRDFKLTIHYKNGVSKNFYPKGFIAEDDAIAICKQSLEKGEIDYFTYEYNQRYGNDELSRVQVTVYRYITITRERRRF